MVRQRRDGARDSPVDRAAYPDVDASVALLAAMFEVERNAHANPGHVMASTFEGGREMYRRMVKANDLPTRDAHATLEFDTIDSFTVLEGNATIQIARLHRTRL